jgi:hypothetical protein
MSGGEILRAVIALPPVTPPRAHATCGSAAFFENLYVATSHFQGRRAGQAGHTCADYRNVRDCHATRLNRNARQRLARKSRASST